MGKLALFLKQLGWMAAIWAASVVSLGLVGGVIRLWLKGR